jgi:hypothetical protein
MITRAKREETGYFASVIEHEYSYHISISKTRQLVDQDVEEIIRSILYNHVHKTLREYSPIIFNSSDVNLNSEGSKIYLNERIKCCLDRFL